ncbi:MAG: cytochrome c [Sulfitobacter sp.]|nr:cytochrome c [Sulfitobacter sp.]
MRRTFIATVSVLLCAGTLALAHTGVKNKTVMKRMEAMKSIGESTKVLGQMAKGERAFDREAARAAAADIARHAERTPALFEEEERDQKDEARAVIWTEFPDFVAKSERLEKVALQLANGLESKDDLRAGLGRIGATCKSCHERYRK